MKGFITLVICMLCVNVFAQEAEKAAVQRTIEAFFDGFHRQDSLQIKQTVSEGVVMRRITMDSTGIASVHEQEFSEFLKAIVGIPTSTEFEEIIKSYSIRIDGPLAHAWTPYEFRMNGDFHHCGVNSFQLFKEAEVWKIIYIIDTGRKNECE